MSASLHNAIIQAIRQATGATGSLPLHAPVFRGNECAYVQDCIETGWVSSVGSYVDRFERDLAAYTGSAFAVAVVNGTAALQVALQLAEIRPGDEVIVPSLTFIATCNAVHYCGAVPHFADVEWPTLGIDPDKLGEYLSRIASLKDGACINRSTGRPIRGVVPMHTFGHPVRLERLEEVARTYGLVMIEDAAESLGSFRHGRHTGTTGITSALSFNGNKIITTGGGGAILTQDSHIARKAKHLTTTAKIPHRWRFDHDEIGYNFRLPNLNAALGCAQLERLPAMLESKRRLAETYRLVFAGLPGCRFIDEPAGCRSNYWLNAIALDDPSERDSLLETLNNNGLMCRPCWTPMHLLPMYRDCPSDHLPNTHEIASRLINLPSSADLSAQTHS
ncbi:LegC family aminotransferase [Kamptonema cortianum]|nr:LegC family aminotransferase [Oscillatoria laete-virens]MDK3155380.1 LegC family aminotransferase [Kamptonema cortianum]MDL5046129.1 LegC family aminotransferase [Oscillatoria amoena NRMC-F 0135]MDL5052829.1 LegC family aminotransferase [Oscillatoria laete-virens NRMC-F 0139]